MLRWLTRLVFFGIIAAAVAFALSKLMGKDEDFDDFDDIDSSFEFQETPVEIDVPADSAPTLNFATTAPGGMGDTMGSATTGATSDGGGEATPSPSTYRATSDTTLLSDEEDGAGTMEAETPAGGGRLIDINGIGPAYEARLTALGIESIANLADADAANIAEQIDVIGGVTTVEDWIGQAKAFVEGKWRGENAGHSQDNA